MFDYLNEVLMIYGKNRRSNTYKRALAMKKRGDAYIFNLLCQEYTSVFKWIYQPIDEAKTIKTELIERTILFCGAVGFAKFMQGNDTYTEETWRNFQVSGQNNLSFYGRPNRVTLSDYAGRVYGNYTPVQTEDLSDIANCALIYDNSYMYSPLSKIFYYAERLSIINTSIAACIQNILGTTVIYCEREQGREIERQREAASIGIPYMIYPDEIDARGFRPELISTPGASEELKVLYEAYDKTHADFLQSCGIRINNEIDKKAGVTPLEIIENRQNIDITLNERLNTRLKGIEDCERIGLYGLKVTLDNFENLTGDYIKTGERIQNVDKKASLLNGGDEDDVLS